MLKKINLLALFLFGAAGLLRSESSWDTERLNLEMSIQHRVEESISKIIPQGQFVLVVRVEPWVQSVDQNAADNERDGGYYLPGVPERTKFDSQVNMKELVNTLKPDSPMFKRFIKQISATLVVDQDISDDTVEKVRELTRQMIGLDPLRGDTLNVQRTVFNKPAAVLIDNSALFKVQSYLRNYSIVIGLVLAVFCIMVFILFMFGPLRGFLNRFVQVLPTLKPNDQGGRRFGPNEMPFMPPYMPPGYGMLPQGPAGMNPSNFSGMLQVENPNKVTLPFSFIREDNLGNLSILLSRETPERAAVVLGYLPPDWISRVLMRMDTGVQNEITSHLATTRQLLPEQVEDIEQELRRRLDYLVGGPDRLIAIYESLEPEAQKRMLESLKDTRPEVADEIRQRSLLFDDLDKLDSASLKAILREIDLQTLAMALRGVSQSFVNKVYENITAGKAEIIKEELEVSDQSPSKAISEAQRKVALVARRLQREGHVTIPQVDVSAPTSRFGAGGLKESLKLPAGMKAGDTVVEGTVAKTDDKVEKDIEERIKKFMKRRTTDTERYPSDTGRGGAG